ncbi:MAG: hypothetical protein ACT4NP_20065 [Pseudonocardiales bacterium]
MSLRVFVACEDHTHDQYILKPVLECLLASIGRARAQVKIITAPRMRGIDALKSNACSILTLYGPLSDAVIFAFDADGLDGKDGRRDRKSSFISLLKGCANHADKAIVVAARQELEVWALWGNRSNLTVSWQAVRSEQHPKELFFDTLTNTADWRKPGKGRSRLIQDSLSTGWQSLKQGCEELQELEEELVKLLS